MVALGGSDALERSKQILDYTMMVAAPRRDSMLLVSILPEAEIDSAVAILDPFSVEQEQIKRESAARKELEELVQGCAGRDIASSFIVITDDHPGYALCKAAKDHNIDCMVVGRRPLGVIKRFLTSSTSKYCLDNAECNVLVCKNPIVSGNVRVDQQGQLAALDKEEKEKRQMAFEGPSIPSGHMWTLRTPAEMQRQYMRAHQESTEAEERAIESKKDLELVHQLEEVARGEQIRDLQSRDDERRRLERTVSLEKVHIAEEEERAYRVRKQLDEDRKEQVMSNIQRFKDSELAIKLEEEEQNRRIKEDDEINLRRVQESKEDLAFVLALEEEERKRRMHQRPIRRSK